MKSNEWSSKFAFIMAATGAAVGLGSIWKFPYMAGNNGGSAFVLIYIAAVIIMGIPIMMAEILIGKLGKENSVKSLLNLATKYNSSKNWQYVGYWGALALLLVLSFYSVIAGWSLAYIYKTFTGELSNVNALDVQNIWVKFLSNPKELLIWHSAFMAMTLYVVACGVKKGIERTSNIMTPGLFFILIALLFYSILEGDFKAGFDFLLVPDFSKVTPKIVIDALGQAFFSLAVGAGCMLVYGTYCPKDSNVGANVIIIATLTILVAILSGLVIFPLVFKYGLSPEAGPGLMFKVLPVAFAKMPFGKIISILFFIFLWFAAMTSSISMAEPLVVLLMEKFKIKRKIASIITGVTTWGLGIIAMLSFNVWDNVLIFNKYTTFDAMADFATNIILPTGALAFTIFSGRIISAKDSKIGLNVQSTAAYTMWSLLIKTIAPICIILILSSGLLY